MVATPSLEDKTIGQNLRILRQSRGMTQEYLAQAIAVTYQQIQKYEIGASAIPATRLHALSIALKVPHAYFFESLPPPTSDGHNKINPAIMKRTLKLQQMTDPVEQTKILKIIDILLA